MYQHVFVCGPMYRSVYLCVKARGQHWASSSIALHLVCWGRLSQWNPELTDLESLTTSLLRDPCHRLMGTGSQIDHHAHKPLWDFWWAKIRISRLCLINTVTKSNSGKKDLFGLFSCVKVHHWGKWGQELKQKRQEPWVQAAPWPALHVLFRLLLSTFQGLETAPPT